jgi:hypothetical protein
MARVGEVVEYFPTKLHVLNARQGAKQILAPTVA